MERSKLQRLFSCKKGGNTMQERLKAYYDGIRKLGSNKKGADSGGKKKKPDARKRG